MITGKIEKLVENPRYRFAVAHSRQPAATPTGAAWIRLTERILDRYDPARDVLITSAGMLHYDIVLRAWLHRSGSSEVYLHQPFSDWHPSQQKQYAWLLNNPLVHLADWHRSSSSRPVTRPSGKRFSTAAALLTRDQQVLGMADVIEAGAINRRGRIHGLVRLRGREGVPVHRRRSSFSETAVSARLDYELNDLLFPSEIYNKYIWHFTRSRAEPWPDETMAEYLDDLLGLRQAAPYSARVVLQRLLASRRILPGTRLIRGGFPVVCFSEATWPMIRSMFHWQAHLRRNRFEPYAIGIRKTLLQRLQILPVIYGPVAIYARLPESEKWRFQKCDHRTTEWSSEAEWRCCGPLNLDEVVDDNLAVLTPDGIRELHVWQ